MATNEYFHAWLRPAAAQPVTRVFGTVMISVPVSALRQLTDPKETAPLRFSMNNATLLKSILPNKKLVHAEGEAPAQRSTHSFTIERRALTLWLAEQQKARPESAFHNVDVSPAC